MYYVSEIPNHLIPLLYMKPQKINIEQIIEYIMVFKQYDQV